MGGNLKRSSEHGQEAWKGWEKRWQRAQALLMVDKADDRTRVPLNAGSRAMALDPALLYERSEERLCVGCVHESRVAIGGWVAPTCSIGKKYGKRCPRYVERSPVR